MRGNRVVVNMFHGEVTLEADYTEDTEEEEEISMKVIAILDKIVEILEVIVVLVIFANQVSIGPMNAPTELAKKIMMDM